MLILGIETSCDETAVAIVKDGNEIICSYICNQIDLHSRFGGVVPEYASRLHLEKINHLIDKAIQDSGLTFKSIDAIAVTGFPGLYGSLLIGNNTASIISCILDIPLIKVNHLYAHIYSVYLSGHKFSFPNIGLVVSGGHTSLYISESYTKHTLVGYTKDDAIGECFDKVSKHFSLGYPGGPIIDKISKFGDPDTYKFPIPIFKEHSDKYNFSYSGLKTAIINNKNNYINKKNKASNICNILASFQKIAVEQILKRTFKLAKQLGVNEIGISGGVSCNSYLRHICSLNKNFSIKFPDIKLTTDNAAMIAGLGYHMYNK